VAISVPDKKEKEMANRHPFVYAHVLVGLLLILGLGSVNLFAQAAPAYTPVETVDSPALAPAPAPAPVPPPAPPAAPWYKTATALWIAILVILIIAAIVITALLLRRQRIQQRIEETPTQPAAGSGVPPTPPDTPITRGPAELPSELRPVSREHVHTEEHVVERTETFHERGPAPEGPAPDETIRVPRPPAGGGSGSSAAVAFLAAAAAVLSLLFGAATTASAANLCDNATLEMFYPALGQRGMSSRSTMEGNLRDVTGVIIGSRNGSGVTGNITHTGDNVAVINWTIADNATSAAKRITLVCSDGSIKTTPMVFQVAETAEQLAQADRAWGVIPPQLQRKMFAPPAPPAPKYIPGRDRVARSEAAEALAAARSAVRDLAAVKAKAAEDVKYAASAATGAAEIAKKAYDNVATLSKEVAEMEKSMAAVRSELFYSDGSSRMDDVTARVEVLEKKDVSREEFDKLKAEVEAIKQAKFKTGIFHSKTIGERMGQSSGGESKPAPASWRRVPNVPMD